VEKERLAILIERDEAKTAILEERSHLPTRLGISLLPPLLLGRC
jgi:hypothetical protein